jgi:hypothetical protein
MQASFHETSLPRSRLWPVSENRQPSAERGRPTGGISYFFSERMKATMSFT